ncbi:GSCOCG00005904001-RA-CDS [Cotesia congregata]|uniref:Uncharacterized protein n=1 Tax=Cotesia congregata TaxID=51543 RepID=A0A8J2HS88_COTCN|nr:GSCOCG00005904001-RA-CDS [Cotesia congregata]CAG5106585.1 Protein of unknown function [Cotesia congregata]
MSLRESFGSDAQQTAKDRRCIPPLQLLLLCSLATQLGARIVLVPIGYYTVQWEKRRDLYFSIYTQFLLCLFKYYYRLCAQKFILRHRDHICVITCSRYTHDYYR